MTAKQSEAETLSAEDTLTIATVKRAVEAGLAEIYIFGGKGRIEFTDESFAAWYSAERAQIAQEVRAKVAEEIERLTDEMAAAEVLADEMSDQAAEAETELEQWREAVERVREIAEAAKQSAAEASEPGDPLRALVGAERILAALDQPAKESGEL